MFITNIYFLLIIQKNRSLGNNINKKYLMLLILNLQSWHSPAALQAKTWAKQCLYKTKRDVPSLRWTPRYGECGQNVHIARKKKRWYIIYIFYESTIIFIIY